MNSIRPRQSWLRLIPLDARLVLIEYRQEDPNIPIAAAHRMSVAEVRTEVGAEGFLVSTSSFSGGSTTQCSAAQRPGSQDWSCSFAHQ
jgi:hypothetical protein